MAVQDRCYDISIPVRDGMIHWPEDPPVRVTTVCDVALGDAATVRRLEMGSHTGTHVDAPCHFLPRAETLDELGLDTWQGPCVVVTVPDDVRAVEACHLAAVLPAPAQVQRLLVKTANSGARWWEQPFNRDFVHLTPGAADWLLAQCPQLMLVGIDYLSVDGFYVEGAPVHHRLLARPVALLEGLALNEVPAGAYVLSALPLRVHQGDGAPARAVLRPQA